MGRGILRLINEDSDAFQKLAETLPKNEDEQLSALANYRLSNPPQRKPHTVYRDDQWHIEWDVWRPDVRSSSVWIATCLLMHDDRVRLRCMRDLRLKHIPALCNLSAQIRLLQKYKLCDMYMYMIYRPSVWLLTVHIHHRNIPPLEGACYHVFDTMVTLLNYPRHFECERLTASVRLTVDVVSDDKAADKTPSPPSGIKLIRMLSRGNSGSDKSPVLSRGNSGSDKSPTSVTSSSFKNFFTACKILNREQIIATHG
jgi:hypothetical protein